MIGSAEVLRRIRNTAMVFIVLGVFVGLVGLLFLFVGLGSSDSDGTGMTIFGLIFAGLAATLLYFGIRDRKDPAKSGTFKSNPDVLAMADELAADIRYDDKFIYMSSRIIAPKKNWTSMTYLDEIYAIYLYTQSYNFIPTGKDIVLRSARGDIHISVYGQKKDTIDQLANMIISVSPNARVGYTPENLKYADAMRARWKEMRNNGYTGN